MSTLENRIAEVLAAHQIRYVDNGTGVADAYIGCRCIEASGIEWKGLAVEDHLTHQAAALAPVIAEVYDDGRRAGVATHEHGRKGCFFDLAKQPNPYRPS